MEDVAALHKVMYMCVGVFPPLDCMCMRGRMRWFEERRKSRRATLFMLPQVSVVGSVLLFVFPFLFSLSLFFFSNLCTSIARGSDRGPIMTIVYTNRTVQQYPVGGRVGRMRRRTNPIPGLDRQAHSSTRGPPPRIEGLFYGCFNTSSVSVYRADDDALGEPEKVTILLPE